MNYPQTSKLGSESVKEVLGFRVWRVQDNKLYPIFSTRSDPWTQTTQAHCDAWTELSDCPHFAPDENCTCGLSAFYSFSDLAAFVFSQRIDFMPRAVLGEYVNHKFAIGLVRGTGKIIADKNYWRASKVEILSFLDIDWDSFSMPVSNSNISSAPALFEQTLLVGRTTVTISSPGGGQTLSHYSPEYIETIYKGVMKKHEYSGLEEGHIPIRSFQYKNYSEALAEKAEGLSNKFVKFLRTKSGRSGSSGILDVTKLSFDRSFLKEEKENFIKALQENKFKERYTSIKESIISDQETCRQRIKDTSWSNQYSLKIDIEKKLFRGSQLRDQVSNHAALGYRRWTFDLYNRVYPVAAWAEFFMPGWNIATCAANRGNNSHSAPATGALSCHCGFNAWDRLNKALSNYGNKIEYSLVGSVAGAGNLALHYKGWRSEKAALIAILLPPRLGLEDPERERRIQIARSFSVPVFEDKELFQVYSKTQAASTEKDTMRKNKEKILSTV